MTTFMILFSIISILLLLYSIYKLSRYIYRQKFLKNDDEFRARLATEDIFLLLLSIILISISILSPFLLTRESVSKDFDFTTTGQIGDTVGGLMSPFINLSAVIVTGLAFYMQYKANKLQVKLFKTELEEAEKQFKKEQEKQEEDSRLQQFESQFYEMLRLHKENVNEVEIFAKRKSRKSEVATKGKGLVIEYYYEFSDYLVTRRNAFVEMQKELEFMIDKVKDSDTPNLDFTIFRNIYGVFFWGLSGYDSLVKEKVLASSKKYNDILYLTQQLQYSRDLLSFNEGISFDIPAFKGHSNFLGHYYRHLFHTVKFVVYYDEKILSEENKINYLRLLRAQLSNHEQALLFYNWIAEYGKAWEDKDNFFLSKYKMIHNLWYENLPQEKFIQDKLKLLVNNYKRFDSANFLFESGDSDIENY